MSYSKQGTNYGIGQLTITQIDADLTYLRQHFDYIRISYPNFNSSSVPYWQDVCQRAKAKGFYVMWGISCPKVSSIDWYKFLQTFIDMSAWAAANGVVFGVNEEMYHNDDTIIADRIALIDLHQAARMAKLKNPTVKLAISLAGQGELDAFIANGSAGAFDYVCLNQYDTLAVHKTNVDKLTAAYGAATRVTEFNTGRGFDPAYGNEASWKTDIQARADYIQASLVAAFYIYTYAHNAEEAAPGVIKWDFRTGQNPETQHQAFDLFRRP